MDTTHEKIRAQLERLAASPEFARTDRMARFLRFVVDQSLLGNADALKERQIGIKVFDRPQDWDPKLDNIVRSEARRLRAKLDAYAATANPDETVRITMPKGGYAVEFKDLSPPAPAAPACIPATGQQKAAPLEGVETKRPWRMSLMYASAMALLVAAALIFLIGNRRRTPVAAKSENFEIVPFSTELGLQFSPAVSPDGSKIAFVWDGNRGKYDIYVKSLKSGDALRFTSDASPDTHPAWSPDGTRIAFLRGTPADSQLVLKNTAGGSERILRLIHVPLSTWSLANPMANCQSPTWSPDGKQILLTNSLSTSQGFGLVLISTITGEQQVVTAPPGEDQDCYSRFAPDGKQIAFVRYLSHAVGDIYTTSADGSGLKRITSDARDLRGLDWTPDSRRLVFAVKQRGSYELRTINTSGGTPQPLPSDTTSASDPSLARDGRWMAYVESEENWNLWKAKIEKGHLEKPERFLPTTGKNHSPSFSPDGKTMAFVSDRSGNPEIWFAALDGSSLRQMTHFNGPWLGTIRWSPDSLSIVFDARPYGHSSIFTLTASGGDPKPLHRENFEVRRPAWSRDGQSIYFDSTRAGRDQIWKLSLMTGATVAVTPVGTSDASESLDGHKLLFLAGQPDTAYGVWLSRTDGSDAAALVGVKPNPDLDWAVSKDGVYFVVGTTGFAEFLAYDLQGLRIHSLGKVAQSLVLGTPSLAISPDGKSLFYAAIDQTKSDIRIRREAPGAGHSQVPE